MNRIENLQIISEFGDHIQLAYGAEFGYYASQMDYDLILKFCENFNARYKNQKGLKLSLITPDKPHTLRLKNELTDLNVHIKLLDHSVFIQANETDWKKIDNEIFNILQSSWRKFLANNIDGYREHFNHTCILKSEQTCHSL